MRKLGILAACLMSIAALAGVAIYEDGVWQSGFPGSQGYRVYSDGLFQDPDAVAAAAAGVTDFAYYLFAADTNTQPDSSSVGVNELTLYNTPLWVDKLGTVTKHYDLEASSNEYGEVVGLTEMPSAFPLRFDFLLRKESTATRAIAVLGNASFSSSPQIALRGDTGAGVRYEIYDGVATTPRLRSTDAGYTMTDGVWYFISAVSYSTNDHRLYWNGVEIDQSTAGVSFPAISNKLSVGLYPAGTGYAWDGAIALPRLWSTTGDVSVADTWQSIATNIGWLDGIDVNIASGDEFLTNGIVLASSYEYAAAADQSGNGYHGTVNGATHTVDGSGNFASYDFNGLNNTITHSTSLTLSFPLTLTGWIYPDITNAVQRSIGIFDNSVENKQVSLYINTSGQLGATYRDAADNNAVAGGTILQTNWTHVAGVFTTSNIIIYVNGVAVGTNTTGQTFDTAINDFAMGAFVDVTPIQYFNGKIDDVRFVEAEWSAAQVLTAYQTSTNQVAR